MILLFADGADSGSRMGIWKSPRARPRRRDHDLRHRPRNRTFNGRASSGASPTRSCTHSPNETGGGFFDLKVNSDLGASFTRIAQELRSQCLIGFSPAALDGKVHRLKFESEARAEDEKPPATSLPPKARTDAYSVQCRSAYP